MTTIQMMAFFGPIALVIALYAANSVFKGKKTNILGLAVTVLGGLQTMDWSFIPADASSALLTGSGLAVMIVSHWTERA